MSVPPRAAAKTAKRCRVLFRLSRAEQASAAPPRKSSSDRDASSRGVRRIEGPTIMYASRLDDDCTGCTGPARQACKVRPNSRPLAPIFPAAMAQISTSLGDQLRFEVHGPFDGESAQQGPTNWISRLRSGFAAIRHKAAQRRRDRLIASELSALDDRTLRDIGLNRPEIDAAITRALRGGR